MSSGVTSVLSGRGGRTRSSGSTDGGKQREQLEPAGTSAQQACHVEDSACRVQGAEVPPGVGAGGVTGGVTGGDRSSSAPPASDHGSGSGTVRGDAVSSSSRSRTEMGSQPAGSRLSESGSDTAGSSSGGGGSSSIGHNVRDASSSRGAAAGGECGAGSVPAGDRLPRSTCTQVIPFRGGAATVAAATVAGGRGGRGTGSMGSVGSACLSVSPSLPFAFTPSGQSLASLHQVKCVFQKDPGSPQQGPQESSSDCVCDGTCHHHHRTFILYTSG